MILTLALATLSAALWLGLAYWGRYRAWVWYDNVAHAAAGACLAALATLALGPLASLAAVTVLALAWEAFEWAKDIHPWGGATTRDAAWEDTALDTCMVWGGALVALALLTPWPV